MHLIGRTPARRRLSRGFSVVELMVAITLSLILLSGVVALFVSSRKSYESNEHLARIQETGRFILDQIVRDIRAAGYLGCAKEIPFNNALNDAASSLLWDFANPIRGFDATGSAWLPALDTTLVPSATVVNSDVLVIRAPDPDAPARRITTAMASPTDDITIAPATPAYPAGTTLMASDCNAVSVFEVTGYTAGVVSHADSTVQAAETDGVASAGNSSAGVGYAFQAGALVFPVRTVIYYLRQSATAGRGNSLWRRVGRAAPQELAEGVDTLQVLYGVDSNGDRIADDYLTANSVTHWENIISVRVALLVRSLEQYGKNPDTAHEVLGVDIAAAGDNRERLMFSTTTTLRNKAL